MALFVWDSLSMGQDRQPAPCQCAADLIGTRASAAAAGAQEPQQRQQLHQLVPVGKLSQSGQNLPHWLADALDYSHKRTEAPKADDEQ